MKKQKSDKYYHRIYKIFLPIFRLLAKIKYGVKKVKPKRYDEPVLFLANHTTDIDFVCLTAHIKNHSYVVCSQHVLGMGALGKLVKRCFNPITVHKGAIKQKEVMEIIRRLRAGNNVLLYPEGRLSHNGFSTDIDVAVAKLVKMAKCKVVTFRTSGGFFKQPRWQTYQNKGKLFSYGIVNEYDKNTLANMSVEQIIENIRNDLFVNAYAEQQKLMRSFKLKKGLQDVTRYYNVCPKCKGIDTLISNGDTVACSCGYSMSIDKYFYYHSEEQIVSTYPEWESLMLGVYKERFNANKGFYDNGVYLSVIQEENAKQNLVSGQLTCDVDGLYLGEYNFKFNEMEKLEILQGGSALVFTVNGAHYQLEKDKACLNKYLEFYRFATGKF